MSSYLEGRIISHHAWKRLIHHYSHDDSIAGFSLLAYSPDGIYLTASQFCPFRPFQSDDLKHERDHKTMPDFEGVAAGESWTVGRVSQHHVVLYMTTSRGTLDAITPVSYILVWSWTHWCLPCRMLIRMNRTHSNEFQLQSLSLASDSKRTEFRIPMLTVFRCRFSFKKVDHFKTLRNKLRRMKHPLKNFVTKCRPSPGGCRMSELIGLWNSFPYSLGSVVNYYGARDGCRDCLTESFFREIFLPALIASTVLCIFSGINFDVFHRIWLILGWAIPSERLSRGRHGPIIHQYERFPWISYQIFCKKKMHE